MPEMSRFTVLNETSPGRVDGSDGDSGAGSAGGGGNRVYISKSLFDKLAQQQDSKHESELVQQTKPTTSGSAHTDSNKVVSSSSLPTSYDVSSNLNSNNNNNNHNLFGLNNESTLYNESYTDYGIRGQYQQQLDQYRAAWIEQYEQLAKLNEKLFQLNQNRFEEKVDQLSRKYFPNHHASYEEAPCKEAELKAMECFKMNNRKPLLCNNQVREFVACVKKETLAHIIPNNNNDNNDEKK